mmetsp:Transcript_853/g.3116  ORF Transcript_853/g.3116 Transcript_853/m.3116 type:complete len:214 (-) Transcript_853:679-1320(-)
MGSAPARVGPALVRRRPRSLRPRRCSTAISRGIERRPALQRRRCPTSLKSDGRGEVRRVLQRRRADERRLVRNRMVRTHRLKHREKVCVLIQPQTTGASSNSRRKGGHGSRRNCWSRRRPCFPDARVRGESNQRLWALRRRVTATRGCHYRRRRRCRRCRRRRRNRIPHLGRARRPSPYSRYERRRSPQARPRLRTAIGAARRRRCRRRCAQR